MKNYRITVNGTAYDVAVEELGAGAAPAAVAAPAPVAAAAPAPAAPAAPAAAFLNFFTKKPSFNVFLSYRLPYHQFSLNIP